MTALTAAASIFAALLAIAGATKIADPAATGAALQGARLPSDLRLVRVLGGGEILLGGAVLLLGGPALFALLGAAYAAFTAFAWYQSRRGASCGCFGETGAPATRLHVGVDAVGAAVSLAAAATHAPAFVRAIGGDAASIVLAGALLLVATAAVRLSLTALPELATATALGTEGDA